MLKKLSEAQKLVITGVMSKWAMALQKAISLTDDITDEILDKARDRAFSGIEQVLLSDIAEENAIYEVLDDIGDWFDRIEIHSCRGDVRSGHPFQYVAHAKHRDGDDDAADGIGFTVLDALKDLKECLVAMDIMGK